MISLFYFSLGLLEIDFGILEIDQFNDGFLSFFLPSFLFKFLFDKQRKRATYTVAHSATAAAPTQLLFTLQ